ncbi:hypothetical protein HPP92_014957 [Vanilla planifolia]|uniref:Uncharacterized protein n=1 Tax=Vanilla planifolia TaxID=51239 RepID=A0A835QML0_VANPL|nr:hypothetical protein HPP92_014957 [Vanilla planifolia]
MCRMCLLPQPTKLTDAYIFTNITRNEVSLPKQLRAPNGPHQPHSLLLPRERLPKKCQEIDKAIRNGDEKYLRAHLRRVKTEKAKKLHDIEEPQETLSTVNWVDDPLQIASMANKKTELEQQEWLSAVNMSGDPLLSVVIAYEKNDLALRLLEEVDDNDLLDANLQRNNALHVAAAVGDGAIGIANALLEKNPKLINEKNEDNETPLLRAALYGRGQMFWELINNGGRDNVNARKKDGSNILHCAIMGNSPKLALEIAMEFPILRITRNEAAVTPLQLVVTIPGAFKSKMQFEPLEAFIYQCIPIGDQGIRETDESLQRKGGGYDEHLVDGQIGSFSPF